MHLITPQHKKRFILEVLTSSPMERENFEKLATTAVLEAEVKLNSGRTRLRWHVKEETV